MDRVLAPEIRRRDRRRRALQVAVPILVVAVLIIWRPGWMRPSLNRARIRTARVSAGPVSGHHGLGRDCPQVERVLSSGPLDARVLRLLQRPGLT